ncbi:helix-turn-helix transcriptional regulator [Micromonospora vinacea]|uniref:helix-turn-helix domain-containing protein n=1 Tax=Micromonospora vinacea TaxID=709878 RepID=UPI0034527506
MTSTNGTGLPPGAARDLVDLLRRLASGSGLSNASIAQKTGVSASYVSQILRGLKIPSPDVAARLVGALNGGERPELTARGLAEQAAEVRRYERARRAAEGNSRADVDSEATAVSLLLSLDAAHLALRRVADAPPGPGRTEAVLQAVAGTALYADRERVLVSAGPDVASAAEAAFLALVEIRNAVRAGASLPSEAYHLAYHPFAEAVWSFRQAIRASVGREPLTPAGLRRQDWSDVDRCSVCHRRFTTIDR